VPTADRAGRRAPRVPDEPMLTMSTTVVAEEPDSPDARQLIAELDGELVPQYPPRSHHGYSVEKLLREQVAFYVVRRDGAAAGCGGVQICGNEYAEVKRMYVRPRFRRLGLGKLMLGRLEAHARRQSVSLLRLETGIYQIEAIALYEAFGFRRIAPFANYWDDPLSAFYEKCIG
jgi:ribosomal protein S18 acetylase RimI-like enzyme